MVTMLKVTSNTMSRVARKRFRGPWSVAKYQPKRMSKTSPIKKVSAGVMLFLQDVRNGRLLHFNFHVVSHFHGHGRVFHVGDHPVNPRGGYHAVARFQGGDEESLFLLPPHLGPEKNKIHNDKNQNDGDERRERIGTGAGGCRGLGLSEK